jgi:hypothetical protein
VDIFFVLGICLSGVGVALSGAVSLVFSGLVAVGVVLMVIGAIRLRQASPPDTPR